MRINGEGSRLAAGRPPSFSPDNRTFQTSQLFQHGVATLLLHSSRIGDVHLRWLRPRDLHARLEQDRGDARQVWESD